MPLMSSSTVIEGFITSATLEVRFMPGIDLNAAARVAQAILEEVKASGSYGAQAHVISREDHLSISVEDVELREMTAAAYGQMLGRCQEIARRTSRCL
jgi:hypothetical protein